VPQPRSRALKLSASYMRASGVMGASIYSTHYRPGEVDMWLLVFSGESGDLAGILHGKALSLWKTACTGAVAVRHLARADARRAALIGTGRYATTQLRCLAAVRPLEEVRCYSRDPDRLAAFVQEAGSESNFASAAPRLIAARSARDALDGADIVVTITTSPVPVVEGAWLAPGMHVNALGQHAPAARELDSAAVVRSRVFVDAREQALAEKGELLIPLAAGEIDQHHVRGELGEVVAQRVPGRISDEEVTLFCSGGTALEYMGLCGRLLERGRAAGIGHPLD
jgi:ornithine cyclodeaminase/alanine dehydrogenase-like protein (mu-crystallin family)